MRYPLRDGRLLIFVVTMLCSGWGVAGLDEGLEALKKGDYVTAARELRQLAEQGDAEAQYRIGLMYEFGKGYPRTGSRASRGCARRRHRAHRGATVELGVIYMTGDGVPQDDVEAVAGFARRPTRAMRPRSTTWG